MPRSAEPAAKVRTYPLSLLKPAIGRGASIPLSYLLPLRLFVGWFFLNAGLSKLGPFLHTSELRSTLARWAADNPYPFYKGFLATRAQDYSGLLAYLVAYGEIIVGAMLMLGLFTRLACAVGILLVANYYLASGHTGWVFAGIDQAFFVALVTLAAAGAGRVAGLDGHLLARAPTLPFRLLY
jgi:uncharacterized membrane protein YphA (DoxX/SURF4 family)